MRAEQLIITEILEEKRIKLTELFESQLKKLKSLGVPKEIRRILKEKKKKVITRALEMKIGEGNIPFLPVIPEKWFGIHALMMLVEHDGRKGFTILDPNKVTDMIETSNDPYYIFDVEDGRAMIGVWEKEESAIDVVTNCINTQGRSCLTVAEVIALGIHTEVLSHHFVDALGSIYDSYTVITLCLYCGKKPELFSDLMADIDYGTPASCDFRSRG